MIHDADKMNAPAQIFVWATIILSIMEDFEECQGFPKAVTSLQQMSKIEIKVRAVSSFHVVCIMFVVCKQCI